MRILALSAAALLLSGCASHSVEPDADLGSESSVITITSADLGAAPRLADGFAPQSPQRIVSLATGIGETLVALGAADRIVGRDETSDIAELSDIPIVTKAHNVSTERVLALDPDLILIDAATSPPEVVDQLRASGIRVIEIPDAWTPRDIDARVAAVAQAIGALNVQPVDFPTDTAQGAQAPRVAFLYLRGPAAIYLLGGAGSGADALIGAAGGIDVGAEAGYGPFTPLTAEALISANPDVLLVMQKGLESVGGVEGLVSLPGVSQTSAAKDRRVISVDDGVLLSFGPRTPALVDQLRRALEQRP